MTRKVLLLQLGEAPEPVRRVHGPFATWYDRVWGESPPLVHHDARSGGRGPDPRDFAGVVVTGSAASLVTREAWMDDAADFTIRAAAAGVPVLGVCFGHQLVGHAFGGRVVRNPSGWEIGSFDIEVTDGDDPLFAGLASRLRVNLVHQDMVEAPPGSGLRVLARNARTPIQALAWGDHVRGVQFHPEIDGTILRGYLDARRSLLTDQDPDRLIAGAGDSADGVAVLSAFRERFVARS
jgi:GMP synthase (glutamine-hydrolysing)